MKHFSVKEELKEIGILKKWANPGLFLFIFGLFKQTPL